MGIITEYKMIDEFDNGANRIAGRGGIERRIKLEWQGKVV